MNPKANDSQDKRNKHLLIASVVINFLLLLGLLYFWLWRRPQQCKGLLNNISDFLKGIAKVESKDLKELYSLDKRKSEFDNKKDAIGYFHEYAKIARKQVVVVFREILKKKKRIVAIAKSLERMAKKLEKVEMGSEDFKNGNIQVSKILSTISKFLSIGGSDLFDETIKSFLKNIDNSSDVEFIGLTHPFAFKIINQLEYTIDSDAKNEGGLGRDFSKYLFTEERITFDVVQNIIYVGEEILAVSQILEEEL